MSGIGYRRKVTFEKTVVGDGIMPSLEQPAKTRASNVARAAGQEDLHRRAPRSAKIAAAAARKITENQSTAFECFDIFRGSLDRLEQNASAPGVQSGENVTNQVAHHPRRSEIQLQIGRCTQQHAWPWFAILVLHHGAIITARSNRAVINTIDRSAAGGKLLSHLGVNLVESIFCEHSSTDGRLVGYQHDRKAGTTELLQGFGGSGQETNQRGISKDK